MKLISFLHLFAITGSITVFLFSVWEHNINWYALTTGLYAFNCLLLTLTNSNESK